MLRRTASPIASVCPIQAFSTKSLSPPVSNTMFFGQTVELKASLRIQHPQPVQRRWVSRCTTAQVEKRTLRQTKIGDGVRWSRPSISASIPQP